MLFDLERKDWLFLGLDLWALGLTLWGLIGRIYLLGGAGALATAVVVWLSFNHFKHKKFPFWILSHHTVLDFLKADGSLMHYTKEQRIRPNKPDLNVYLDSGPRERLETISRRYLRLIGRPTLPQQK